MGALSSISNRVSGIMLSFGAAGVGTVELVGGTGSALQLMQAVGSASNPVLLVAGAKFSVAFPLIYHYLGAVRHMIWDKNPDFLTNVGVEQTSYYLFGTSLLLSGGLMVL